jgi:large subunit ribosomal protein L25
METQTIQASTRSGTGKGIARKLRRDGWIPAVAYGGGGETACLSLDPAELALLRKSRLGWNMPVSIQVEGGDDIALALLRDVQKHPVSRALLHADFIRVDADTEVRVRVPIRLEGRAAGAEIGGLISQPNRVILVACLPTDIPVEVAIDITEMEIGDRVLLSSIPMPEGCRAVFRFDGTAVACVGRRGGALEDEETEDEVEADDEEEVAEE